MIIEHRTFRLASGADEAAFLAADRLVAAAALLFQGAFGQQVDRDLERMTRAIAVGYESAAVQDPRKPGRLPARQPAAKLPRCRHKHRRSP